MRVVAGHGEGPKCLRSATIARIMGALIGLLAVASCIHGGSPGPETTSVFPTSAPQGNEPPSNVPQCVRNVDDLGNPVPLTSIPSDFYQETGRASPATLPGDIICSNEISAPDGYRAWVFLYWVQDPTVGLVQVSATIRIKTTILAPPGGRPILSWAHGTQPGGITDVCAPSLGLPRGPNTPYGPYPLLPAFLDAGFAVVGTDYVGLGMPGVHPYLVGKSEGAAVLFAARAAQNFSPAQASGQVIIMGHSQGGHAALFADYMASAYVPGMQVRGVIALAPPTDLAKIARYVIDDQSPDNAAVINFLIAAGSWHRLYEPYYPYPGVLTMVGTQVADAVSDPDVRPSPSPSSSCSPPQPTSPGPLIQEGELPVQWTNQLVEQSVPTDSLSRTIPLLVVQGTDDRQVPYLVTLTAVRDICAHGVQVTFDEIQGGDHLTPLGNQNDATPTTQVEGELAWAQKRVHGDSVENSCGSPPVG
jgi:pimeloyl-ACP methyl ester carboxylesterase